MAGFNNGGCLKWTKMEQVACYMKNFKSFVIIKTNKNQ